MHSGHNASGYFTVYGDEALQSDHFNSRLSFGDTQTIWARTGYLGFLRRTELTDASGGEDSAEMIREYRHCVIDGAATDLSSVLI